MLQSVVSDLVAAVGVRYCLSKEYLTRDLSATCDSTMYAMAALLVVALLANVLIRPVVGSHYVENAPHQG